MSLFVLDTSGNRNLLDGVSSFKPTYENPKENKLLKVSSSLELGTFAADLLNNDEEVKEEYDLFGLPPPSVDISNIIENTLAMTRIAPSKVEEKMDEIIQQANEAFEKKGKKSKIEDFGDLDHSDFNEFTGKRDELEKLKKSSIEKELVNSRLGPNFEQLKELPSITKKKQREINKIERTKTKGKGWFNMPATELTEERENDLKILQMRSVLNPKHFYKKNDLKVLPKYFQIGTVQHSPLDYFNERDNRRNKKRSLVDELLADTEAQKYIKRKHKEIMINKQKYAHRNTMNKMKKLKKNKK